MILEKEKVHMSSDLLFKEILCHEDNREKLIHFLKLITDIDEKNIRSNLSVQYESVLKKTKLNEKAYRADIIIKFDNYVINLESYSYFNESSFRKSTNYIMRIYSTLSKPGIESDHLQSVIQINLIDNVKMKFDPSIISEYYIINGNNIDYRKISDEFKIKYYRIDKAKKVPYNELDEEIRWIRFLGAQSSEERRKISEGDELLMELNDWVEKFVNDEEIKEYYGKWAEEIALEKGKEIGKNEGKKEGKKESKKEIAKRMKEENLSIELISKITDLSDEEIKNLQ